MKEIEGRKEEVKSGISFVEMFGKDGLITPEPLRGHVLNTVINQVAEKTGGWEGWEDLGAKFQQAC